MTTTKSQLENLIISAVQTYGPAKPEDGTTIGQVRPSDARAAWQEAARDSWRWFPHEERGFAAGYTCDEVADFVADNRWPSTEREPRSLLAEARQDITEANDQLVRELLLLQVEALREEAGRNGTERFERGDAYAAMIWSATELGYVTALALLRNGEDSHGLDFAAESWKITAAKVDGVQREMRMRTFGALRTVALLRRAAERLAGSEG